MILPTATKGDRGAGEALAASEKVEEAIYTCKYPGCTRQYASTDGERREPGPPHQLAPLGRAVGARVRVTRARWHLWARKCPVRRILRAPPPSGHRLDRAAPPGSAPAPALFLCPARLTGCSLGARQLGQQAGRGKARWAPPLARAGSGASAQTAPTRYLAVWPFALLA